MRDDHRWGLLLGLFAWNFGLPLSHNQVTVLAFDGAHAWDPVHQDSCGEHVPSLAFREAVVPAVLIHGRRDISGPAIIAWEVHQSLPGSELVIDEGDGHGGDSMAQRWRTANDQILAHWSTMSST